MHKLPEMLAGPWLALWVSLAIPSASLGAGDPADAKRWLDLSDKAAASLQPSGVYASYALTRIRLVQALAYALLGDVENTQSRLPYAGDPRPEWSSGGDGMVRTLMVSLDLDEIHASLLTVLAEAGSVQDAFEYAAGLTPEQNSEGAYLQLGMALARADRAMLVDTPGLTASQQANATAGKAWVLLERDDLDDARDVLLSIEPEETRIQTIAVLGRKLIAENQFANVVRLLELGVLPESETSALASEALSFTLLSGDLATATQLADRAGESVARDGVDAQLAFALAVSGEQTRAAKVFDQVKLKQAPMWEQVAMRLNRDAWLEKYYLALNSPWRRTERLYQFAVRKLTADDRNEADRLAALAEKSAEEIPAGSTRWLALELLAEYYAKAAEPPAAAAMAAKIADDTPDGQREKAKADAAVVEAWARAGGIEQALRAADGMADPLVRASGLTAAANAAFANDRGAYERLVLAAQSSLGSMDESRFRERQGGWARLVTMQCRVGDMSGAMKSAASATSAGDAAAAHEAIVKFAIEAGDLNIAEQAARALPAGMDFSVGQDHRRGEALGQVTKALAANGDGRAADVLLEDIEQQHVRELATAAVAEALIAQGEQDKAIELAIALRRNDAREHAVGVVLRAMAEQHLLPDPEQLMSRVPERTGAEVCWASAAAAGADRDRLDPWLQALDQPACRAFAYAGAAYAVRATPAELEPADLFSRSDPAMNEARMLEAMQKNAARQTRK
jgi:hypothetical protein